MLNPPRCVQQLAYGACWKRSHSKTYAFLQFHHLSWWVSIQKKPALLIGQWHVARQLPWLEPLRKLWRDCQRQSGNVDASRKDKGRYSRVTLLKTLNIVLSELEFDEELFQYLLCSMPERLKQVRRAKRDETDYSNHDWVEWIFEVSLLFIAAEAERLGISWWDCYHWTQNWILYKMVSSVFSYLVGKHFFRGHIISGHPVVFLTILGINGNYGAVSLQFGFFQWDFFPKT